MPIAYYPAIIERGVDGLGVYLPGCVTAARTIREAALRAEGALSGHLAVAAEYGDASLALSELDAIDAFEGSQEVGRIPVVGDLPWRAVRVQV